MLSKNEDGIPVDLGVLSYLSLPGRWRSAISNFPLGMVEGGNLQCLGAVCISCPNLVLFLKNTEVRAGCSVEVLVWIISTWRKVFATRCSHHRKRKHG